MVMPQVEVKVNEAQLKRVHRMLKAVPRELPGVMSRAINRTARWGLGELARKISAATGLKQKAVRKGIRLRKATRKRWQAKLDLGPKSKIGVFVRKAGFHDIKAIGSVKGHISLIAFRARKTKKGATYQMSGKRGLVKSAFKQTMPKSGHKGIFIRRGKTRLPIDEVYGPSLGGIYENVPGLARRIRRTVGGRLAKEIDSQVSYVLSKRAR